MRKTLRHDPDTGELRLVYTDLWQGQHERTEYRVWTRFDDGERVRNRADLDGREVSGVAPDLYIANRVPGAISHTLIWTEPVPVGPTVKTPCPRASSARRKCSLCAGLAA
jgi:hypothetical protein